MEFRHSGIQALRFVLVIVLVLVVCRSDADVKIEQIEYHGWKGSYRMSNGTVELVFVPQIGRIMRYAFIGGKNVLWENQALFGKTVDLNNIGKEWTNFGGDKLWPAPQSRWNWPPNPVLDAGMHTVSIVEGSRLLVVGKPSPKDGIRFGRLIVMAPDGSGVTIHNTMSAVTRARPVSWSVWEVAQVDEPDRAVLPLDSRHFKAGYYVFKANPPSKSQVTRKGRALYFERGKQRGAKIGGASRQGWLAAEKDGIRFRVWAKYPLKGAYPDDGCAQEIWSNPDPLKYMELELLSPIVILRPDKAYTFETKWELTRIQK